MPSSYSLYRMVSFPDESFITIPTQVPMNFDMPGLEAGEPPRTDARRTEVISRLGLERYEIFHESFVDAVGRVNEVRFTKYISQRRFPAYYSRDLKILLLETNHQVATSAMKQLVRINGLKGSRRKIVLDSIRPFIRRFKGGWWSVDDSANVSAQALFGPSIDRDERFHKLSKEGAMYYINFDYEYDGMIVPTGVSDRCNVVIYSKDVETELELEIVLDIKKNLLDRAEDKL